VIQGPGAAELLSGVRVHHAGTTRHEAQTLTAGSRVLGVTGVGPASSGHGPSSGAADLLDFAGTPLRRGIGPHGLWGKR
jgi:phosphoribosylamine-glycine ligase